MKLYRNTANNIQSIQLEIVHAHHGFFLVDSSLIEPAASWTFELSHRSNSSKYLPIEIINHRTESLRSKLIHAPFGFYILMVKITPQVSLSSRSPLQSAFGGRKFFNFRESRRSPEFRRIKRIVDRNVDSSWSKRGKSCFVVFDSYSTTFNYGPRNDPFFQARATRLGRKGVISSGGSRFS